MLEVICKINDIQIPKSYGTVTEFQYSEDASGVCRLEIRCAGTGFHSWIDGHWFSGYQINSHRAYRLTQEILNRKARNEAST